ncbi:response regulator [Minwuia sp.]|uniref:response regulator n=1 Tax=Minwuia sp. TaxID=2493630 RepID=UPI003A917763
MSKDMMHLGGLTALIVDDNRDMRSLMLLILRSLGAGTVLQAETGQEAMNVIRVEEPDFVVLDHRLPDIDGVSVTKMIRTNEDSPNPFLPVLMVTGYAEPEVVFAARDNGVNEFIAKPVSVEAVAHRLSTMINKARPFVRTKEYFGPDRRRRKVAPEGSPRRRASDKEDAKKGGELEIAD